MIEELDTVELLASLPGVNLKAGRQGAVVMVYGNHEAYEVEFYNADWEWTPDMNVPYPAVLATVTPDKVRLVHRHCAPASFLAPPLHHNGERAGE
ncbi:MAG: DUF4926 domain-containing protein [Thermomicrobia bacterium]|nr:DUF4926 domain-containing protein [Thermomicrobia bacterium]